MLKLATRMVLCALIAVMGTGITLRSLTASEGAATARGGEPSAPLAEALGIQFVEASTSAVIIERDGKKYLVDVTKRSVEPMAEPSAPSSLTAEAAGTTAEQPTSQAPAQTERKNHKRGVYEPGDDNVFSLPTGRRPDRHGLYVNFTHRFAFDPAFSGTARGDALLGLDGAAISSFGFRYGVTRRLSVSIYRSPTFIGRPIQLMGAYNFSDEHDHQALNSAVRFSVEGRDNFTRDYTENIEGIFSRSLTSRAQIYVVPTLSLNNRRLVLGTGFESSNIPHVPGVNSFALGIGGSLDIRPSVALVAEVIPTLANGRDLGIHRPAYSFGIQKKIWRHAFTLGFSTSPGTTVSQRSGTRAAFLGDPTADTPSGLFIGFDLTRQIF